MKRFMTISTICLIFIMLIYEPCGASTIDIPNSEDASLYIYSVDHDDIWISNGYTLYLYSSDSEQIKVSTFETEIIGLASNNGFAYVITKDNDAYTIYSISREGREEALFSLPNEQSIIKLYAMDEYMVILKETQAFDSDQGYDFIQYTYHGEIIDTRLSNVFSICPMNGEELGIVQFADVGVELCSYNFRNLDYVHIMHLPWAMPLAYINEELLIGIMNNELVAINPTSGVLLQGIAPSIEVYSDSSIQVGNNNLVIGHMFSDKLYLVSKDAFSGIFQSSGQSITLLNIPNISNDRLLSAIDMFKDLHPDIDVIRKQFTEEQLIIELQANSPDIDIIYVDCEAAPRFIDAGVLGDIAQNSRIMNVLNEWIDIEKTITYDHHIYGVPMTIISTYMVYNNELLDHLNIVFPDRFESWFELLEMGHSLRKEIEANGIFLLSDDIYYPMYVSQYTSAFSNPKDIDFIDPYFIRLTEQYKSLVNDHIISYRLADGASSERALICIEAESLPTVRFSQIIHPLPRYLGQNTNPAYTMAMGFNAHSRNIDLCFDFLECYALSQDSEDEVGFLKDLDRYPDFENYNADERNHLNMLRTIMEDSVPEFVNVVFRPYARECFADYYAGKINVQELAQNLQAKVDMILNE